MSLQCSSHLLNLHSAKNQSFFTQFSTQFIKKIQVSSVSYALPTHFVSSSKTKLGREILRPITASTNPSVETLNTPSFSAKNPKDINILVAGSTGCIGKFVVKELISRGFNVIAIAREKSGIKGQKIKEETLSELKGANVCFSDVSNLETLEKSIESLGLPIDVVVSCLASQTGGIKDSWKIDYEATKNSLVTGKKFVASHFVLLSAICVQKPLLEFQRAKLKFSYSVVRLTAFFKSLGGQVELVKDGKPYEVLWDGKLCACKPMCEQDLARFISDCVLYEDKINQVLPIGGPGKALTPLEQGKILFRLLGKEPKFLKVPIGIMDFSIGVLDFLVKFFPSMEDAAEFGKRYYAAESLLLLDHESGEYSAEKTPSYGKDTLEEFFERVIKEESSVSTSGSSETDLLIVGPGVLGRLVARKWRKENPGSEIYGQTVTSDHHEELNEMGIRAFLKGIDLGRKFPYVIFCAPPSRSADYVGEVREAALSWNGEGSFLFTSSSAPYDCNDNGLCDEDSPIVPIGRSPRTDILLKAENVVLEFSGCVVRLAGLYQAGRGAHTYWLSKGTVDARPDHILNLIHYEDAASLSVSILKKRLRGRIFLGCDNHPLSRQEVMDYVNKSGKFDKKFEAFTGSNGPLGKRLNNSKSRRELGWEPKYPSFSQFLETL